MKSSRLLIIACLSAVLLPSCTKRFECHCALTDISSGLDNGSRVIVMDLNGINARKKAERNCKDNESGLNVTGQTAICHLQ
ncbi:MAG: hypothetical protein JNL72_15835 [Flavipsychrobacter sp.]|nr:hypothetical protein [Flavipsychrobacter sp.]